MGFNTVGVSNLVKVHILGEICPRYDPNIVCNDLLLQCATGCGMTKYDIIKVTYRRLSLSLCNTVKYGPHL